MDTKLTVGKLRCNYLYNPLGVETPNPRLSWVLFSQERGQRQTAYRILVASKKELLNDDIGDMWDSGIVETDQSIHVMYKGKELKSRQRCYWKVKVWDVKGTPSEWSEIAYWEMGLLNKTDWHAQWISAPYYNSIDPHPAPLFRRRVILEKK